MRIVAGRYKNRKILTPKGVHTRPTAEQLREAFFNICQHYISDVQFLDLFSGSGAMGLEALSRGAAHAVFVESDRESVRCIRANIAQLGLENQSTVIQGEVIQVLKRLEKNGGVFDIIYADPPYGKGYSHEIVKVVDGSSLLFKGGFLFVEEAKEVVPYGEPLTTLEFKGSRIMGKALLMQYSCKN